VKRVRRMAELVALRLALPARLDREPLDELLAGLTRGTQASKDSSSLAVVTRDLRLAERGLTHLPWVPSTCLYRSLGRYAVLRKIGADASFVMGLGPGGVAADGHAWVEVDGTPFDERDDVSCYTITFRYPRIRG